MYALQCDRYLDDPLEAVQQLHVVEKPIPKPSSGQVLIKVEAAPCNPSDLLLLQGKYGRKKTLPATPGWEGAGTVVETGGGIMPWLMKGKRVAFSAQHDSGGSWAEYCIAEAKTCIPLQDNISFEQGATLIINPLTAVGMIDEVKKGGHGALIQNAAASQVGRMVLQLANHHRIPAIHIVRRKDQEQLLKELGGTIILNSEEPDFKEKLKLQAEKLHATIAFDAIAGDATATLLNAMPGHSAVWVYGALSGNPCGPITPLSLIFQQKSVKGFYLSEWIAKKGFFGLYQATKQVQKLFAEGSFHTAISQTVSLQEAPEALASYQREMTSGKVIIRPSIDPAK